MTMTGLRKRTRIFCEAMREQSGDRWTTIRFKTLNALFFAVAFFVLSDTTWYPKWVRAVFYIFWLIYAVRWFWCSRNDRKGRVRRTNDAITIVTAAMNAATKAATEAAARTNVAHKSLVEALKETENHTE